MLLKIITSNYHYCFTEPRDVDNFMKWDVISVVFVHYFSVGGLL